jgi:hypothetical protein
MYVPQYMSITSNFVREFDSLKETHVMWLAHMMDIAENMNDLNKHTDLISEVNKNPMKIRLDQRNALDWAHIHFVLCAVYAKAVLRGKAWIPK